MMTGDEYRQSLDDGRVVYFQGDRVDVTRHHVFSRAIELTANTYDRYYSAAEGAISSYLTPPSTVEEMRAHTSQHVDHVTISNYSSLMTLLTAADRIESIRPQGSAAIRKYVKDMQLQDRRLVECITDAKGHRGKPPGLQDDPDAYLHVIERRPDGVVVRGAKLHISCAAIGHELMTIPTKAMKPGEEDYAIAFSIPVNTPGIKIINVMWAENTKDFEDMPLSESRRDSMGFVIYDDVFVPNERIFLDGEVEAAAVLAHSLGLWTRISGLVSMAEEADLMCGFAQLIAEANGLQRIAHIKDKIADMVIHATLIRATLEASLAHGETTSDGVLVPDELYANAGKFQAAAYRTAMMQHLQDIAGGSLTTAPSSRDLRNEEVGGFLRKYMAAGDSVDGAYRLKLFHAVKDLTSGAFAGYQAVAQLHSGGGLFAQRVVTRGRYDMKAAKQKALEAAGLESLAR